MAVDAAAAGVLAAASAFVATSVSMPSPSVFTIAGLAFFSCFLTLRHVVCESVSFAVPEFATVDFAAVADEELLLIDEYRLVTAPEAPEELLLAPELTHFGEDSRVVRLFAPASLPTPGELKAKIDRHLGETSRPGPDASQALLEALGELRRSLR